uniref:AP complex mu/sigma subunit domain-containing protein n=1 Tax=Monopterus albus TaxID=43700 RepID=A0A3Q3KML9_MONAL
MMHFLLLFSRQGKLRLQKWFTPLTDREKKKVIRDMMMLVLARPQRFCNFLQWRDLKIVYKRYASLYFCAALDNQDNELLTLEVLHRYVELLDKYFGNVSRAKCLGPNRIHWPLTVLFFYSVCIVGTTQTQMFSIILANQTSVQVGLGWSHF